MGRHETADAVLDEILAGSVQARARELAEWLTLEFGRPLHEPSWMDRLPSDDVARLRSARDILELVGGITHG